MPIEIPEYTPLPVDQAPDQVRRHVLGQYDLIERCVRDIAADPGPAVRDGQIVRDADGQPLPNSDVVREARHVLALVRRGRAELVGQDLGGAVN